MILVCSFLGGAHLFSQDTKLQNFLARVFGKDIPELSAVWLIGPLKERIQGVLGKPPKGLRQKVWKDDEQTVMVLEHIGKTQPITVAWTISKEQRILNTEVLHYRESRGGEIARESFRKQFFGLSLGEGDKLSGGIDGISGATLSVRAMRNMARQALVISEKIP